MTNYKILSEINLSSIDDIGHIKRMLDDFLKRNKRNSYKPNDRLRIVLGGHDIYTNFSSYGLKLAIIQHTCDEVNISRCFIQVLSTNPNLEEEIKQIGNPNNVNERLNYEYLEGDFKKIKKKSSDYEYGSQIPTKVLLESLSEREVYWLTESKTFCMYPWVHLYASPNGEAQPCCVWDHKQKMCSTKEMNLKEIYNSPQWRKLRLDMMNDRPAKGCKPCYEQERNGFFSNRQSSNMHLGHFVNKITETDDQGYCNNFQLSYWDIRFSNLCNLSCRSCGHIFSSSWYKDQVKLAGPEYAKNNKALFWAGRHKTDMLEQLLEHIDYVEQIYFAGGEPLMMDEHYHILEELERKKKFNVRLVYNTNFTQIKLKDRLVFDYWRKFDSVAVGASLDAMGTRAEYIRKNTVWSEIEENRRKMQEMCPGVDFYISPTISIQNVWHVSDFHKDWVDRGFIKPQDLHTNPVLDPAFLRIDILPDHYKKQVIEKIKKHLEWLRPIDKLQRATQGFESIIHLLETPHSNSEFLMKQFWKRMEELDKLRNENLLETIPELNEITK